MSSYKILYRFSKKKLLKYQAIGERKILQFIRPQTWNNFIIETVIGHIFGIFYEYLFGLDTSKENASTIGS
jgi:hypothetical protein